MEQRPSSQAKVTQLVKKFLDYGGNDAINSRRIEETLYALQTRTAFLLLIIVQCFSATTNVDVIRTRKIKKRQPW
jgi:hypothetical protein